LFAERGHHAFGHLGLVTDELRRGHHEGEVIVDVMPHGGELLIQVMNLLGVEMDGLCGRRHNARYSAIKAKIAGFGPISMKTHAKRKSLAHNMPPKTTISAVFADVKTY
jgi:hypothetical protein